MSILSPPDSRIKTVDPAGFDRWRWQARLSTGHEPRSLDRQRRGDLRDWLLDLLATCRSDAAYAGELRALVVAVFNAGRESA